MKGLAWISSKSKGEDAEFTNSIEIQGKTPEIELGQNPRNKFRVSGQKYPVWCEVSPQKNERFELKETSAE